MFDIFIRFIIFNILDLYINKIFILIHNLFILKKTSHSAI